MKKMIELLKRFSAKNTLWKLLSLVIAIGLWMAVMSTLNPTETKTFTVPVTLSNEEAIMNRGYAILNKQELLNTKVDIKVTGTRAAIDELSKKSNTNTLIANVDLQQIEIDSSMALPQNISISVSPEISNLQLYSYELSNYNPSFVNVSVDSVAEKTMPVKTNLVGQLPDGFVAQEPEYNISEIQIRGSAKKLEQVKEIIATINIDGADSDISVDVVPVAIDANGEEMPDFILIPPIINAEVNINTIKTIKINQPAVKGDLHNDLILQGIEVTPKEVQLVGTNEELEKIKDISLPEIDLSKLLGSDIYTYDLSQYITENDDLYFKSGTPKTITIKVNILGKDGKNLTIPARNVDIIGATSNLISKIPDKITVTVFGAAEDLAKISNNTATLNPTLDITGLTAGGHQVPLQLTLPEGVETREDLSVYVIITEKETATETTTIAMPPVEETTTQETAEADAEATTENTSIREIEVMNIAE